MTDSSDPFIAAARAYLCVECRAKIRQAVEALPEHALWWRPNEQSNSVGNLLVHLSGSVRHWIVSGVHGVHRDRDRDAEFLAREGGTAQVLLADLDRALVEVEEVLAGLTASSLMEHRTIRGLDVTVLGSLFHVVEHFAYHLGQIVLVTKSLAPGATL